MKKNTKNGILAGSCASVWMLLAFWIGGYGFDERGANAVAALIFTTVSGAMAFFATKDLTKQQ